MYAEGFYKKFSIKVSGLKIGELIWVLEIDNNNYSNDIKIYNYIEFDNYLNEMFGKVSYLTFDMIKDGRYRQFLCVFFSLDSLEIINHENQRKEVTKGKVINRSNFYWDNIRLLVPKKLKAKISKSEVIIKLNDWITKFMAVVDGR